MNRPRATLVRGGAVYTADGDDRIHPDGSVLIVGDRIAAVGDTATVTALARDDVQVLDARGRLVLPGLVNGHWHDMFAMRLPFRGALRPPSDTGDEAGPMAGGGDVPALTMFFDRFVDLAGAMSDDEAEAIARYSLWTQLRSGTTAVGDTGSLNRPERLLTAARAVGIRCSVSTWAGDVVCPPGETTIRRTRSADDVLARIETLLSHAAPVPGGLTRARPSTIYVANMSDDLGRGLRDLADAAGTPVVTHVAALRNESAAVRAYFGTTPVRRLADLGLLTDRLMAVHCAFVDDEERAMLVRAGVHISHSPAKYGATGESTTTGVHPFLDAGLDVSLSTDGSVYPIGAMPEAMRAAVQAHNELAADPRRVRPTRALAMATRIAARGLGWADEIGSLEPGKQADLVLVRTDGWRYLLNPRPLEAFLTLGGSADIDSVVVAGKVRVDGGRHVTLDEADLERDYLRAVRSFSRRCLDVDEATLRRVVDPALGREPVGVR